MRAPVNWLVERQMKRRDTLKRVRRIVSHLSHPPSPIHPLSPSVSYRSALIVAAKATRDVRQIIDL